MIGVKINDRAFEIGTTSLAVDPNSLPPLGTLTTFLDEGEIIVWTVGGIEIEKEKDDESE